MRVILALAVLVFTGCTTTSGPSYEQSEILERMSGYDETPKFATGAKVMWEDGQYFLFANIVEFDADARINSCLQASTLKAKSAMLSYISEGITTSGQFEEFESSSSYENLTAFLSQGRIHAAQITDRYWEKKTVSNQMGERVPKLVCASTVKIKKVSLQKQLREATNPKRGGNDKIRNKLIESQEKFLDGLTNQENLSH